MNLSKSTTILIEHNSFLSCEVMCVRSSFGFQVKVLQQILNIYEQSQQSTHSLNVTFTIPSAFKTSRNSSILHTRLSRSLYLNR